MAGPDAPKPAASATATVAPGSIVIAPGVPPLPAEATPEQIDRHWFQHVYQGDRMPQLTVRAVVIGGVLGMLMSAANLYTTLSIGWSFGVAITACVMSYVFWNLLVLLSGGRITQMSVLENACMASTASAAGYSTGATIATMFGALLLLQTGDSASIKTYAVQPIWLVAAFTLCTGLMGVFLAIPMKRQMVNHEQLPFPSGLAAAETLRSLYSASREAVLKAYALVIALFAGVAVGIINTGEDTLAMLDRAMEWIKKTIGFDIRPQELYPAEGIFKIDGKKLIGFGLEPSVLLVAAGMIVGLRVSLTMLVGAVLLYFFVAPNMIVADAAHAGQAGYVPSIELVAGGTIYHVYRWGLWGGTAVMVFSSLTALALQWKTIARAFKGWGKERAVETAEAAEMKAIEVPIGWMIAGMVPITIAMVVLQVVAFQISWWAGIIAVAMSFVLSLVASRATGETDTTPTGAMGKVMQLLFALLHPGQVGPNLASAGIAANSASSSADLLTDLKTGYLLGANPRRQFLAQFFGVFFGTLAIVPIWYLMVPTKAALEKFPAPATNQWYRVAQVLTQGIESLPPSARWAIVIGAMVGVLLPVIERTILPAKWKPYFPSAMGLGLSWILPFSNAAAFALGALITWVWGLISRRSQDIFNVPIASGLIAGESLIKAVIAMTATVVGLMASGKSGG